MCFRTSEIRILNSPGQSRAPLPSCARWTPEQKNSEYFLLDTCRRTCNSVCRAKSVRRLQQSHLNRLLAGKTANDRVRSHNLRRYEKEIHFKIRVL